MMRAISGTPKLDSTLYLFKGVYLENFVRPEDLAQVVAALPVLGGKVVEAEQVKHHLESGADTLAISSNPHLK